MAKFSKAAPPSVVTPVGIDEPAPPAAKTLRKAFTMERVPGGWTMVTLTYDDTGALVSIERTEPDMKAQIIERFKIAAFKYWSTIG